MLNIRFVLYPLLRYYYIIKFVQQHFKEINFNNWSKYLHKHYSAINSGQGVSINSEKSRNLLSTVNDNNIF